MEQTPQLIGVLTYLPKLFIKMRVKYSASKYILCNGQQEMRKRTLFLFAPSLKYSKREKSKKTKEKKSQIHCQCHSTPPPRSQC